MKIYNQTYNNKSIIEKQKRGKMAQEITSINKESLDFIEKLSNSTTETIQDFLKKNTKKIKTNNKSKLYQYNNLILIRSDGDMAYQIEQNLKFLGIDEIAPKYIKYLQLDKNDFLTILELNNQKIMPYTEIADKIPFGIKKNFKEKIQNLASKGIINREIFTNKDAFFVTKDCQKIIFADWSNLYILNQDEKKLIQEKLKNWEI